MAYFHRRLSDNRSSVSALASGSARTPSVPCSAVALALQSHVVRELLFVCGLFWLNGVHVNNTLETKTESSVS